MGLVICLDSGAGNYDQLWLTTSLRGMASGTLKVEILTEGIHSGDASGLVPSSFRIMRQVLDRLEDSKTGRLLPQSFHCQVPADRLAQAQATAAIPGRRGVPPRFPWAHYDCGGSTTFALPTTTDPVQALLKRTWEPTLSVTGAEGFPHAAGRRQRAAPYTAFKLSLRLPPLVDAAQAVQELKALLEDNAPYQAKVTFESLSGATGWNAPATTPWFERALNEASQAHFGAPCGYIGQGGTIPLMNMLSEGFPTAQMMVCGVLGPKSNAHGPNEFPARALRQAPHRLGGACDGRHGPGTGRTARRCALPQPLIVVTPSFQRRYAPTVRIPTLSPFTAADGENLALHEWPVAADTPCAAWWCWCTAWANTRPLRRGGRAAQHLGLCRARLRPLRPRRIRRAARRLSSDTRLLDDLADMIECTRPPAARPAAGAAGPQHGRPGGGAAGVAEPVPGGCAGAVIARAGCRPEPGAKAAGVHAAQHCAQPARGQWLTPTTSRTTRRWWPTTRPTRAATTASAPAWPASLPPQAPPPWPLRPPGLCPPC